MSPLLVSPPQRPVVASQRATGSTAGTAAGFSLVELLVAIVILASALAMAGAMNGVATRGLRSSTILNDRNAAVDADIAAIRSMAERYTWCSGQPALQASNAATCLATTPSDESYYSPAVSQDDALIDDENGNTNKQNFIAACANLTLNDDLVQRINSRPAVAGLQRTAQVMTLGGAPTNRIEILYATTKGDGDPVVRSVVITPPVTAFCQ